MCSIFHLLLMMLKPYSLVQCQTVPLFGIYLEHQSHFQDSILPSGYQIKKNIQPSLQLRHCYVHGCSFPAWTQMIKSIGSFFLIEHTPLNISDH